MNRKALSFFFILFLIILTVSSFFIKIPYTISSKGVVYPYKEWTLSKTTDGNLINLLRNNRTNSISSYSVTEFLRGDASEFVLNKNIFENAIKQGDTIGFIYSNEDYFRLLELQGILAAEQKNLEIYASGEKPETIAYYNELVNLAQLEWDTQKKLFSRIAQLYNDSLISKNEYDIAFNELKLKEHNYKIAVSNLKTVESGAKEEQINLSKSLIENYTFQIEQLKVKIKASTIVAPFEGKIVKQKKANVDLNGNLMDVEEIVKIVDVSSLLVVLPIEFYESKHLKKCESVNFGNNAQGKPINGIIIDMDNTVQILKRRQVIFITVEVTDNIEQMLFNMFVDANIECGEITLFQYFLRLFDTVTEN